MIQRLTGRLSQFRIPVLCCVLASIVAPAGAQLSLDLSTTRAQYLVDEFLYVTITMTNVGSTDTPFTRFLQPDVGIVTFEIMTPDGQTHAYEPRGRASLSKGAPERSILWLAPGGHYTASVDLSYEMSRVPGKAAATYLGDAGVVKALPWEELRPTMVLSAPGEYSIRACYVIPAGWPLEPITLWSDELHVSVTEPTGQDLVAYSVIQMSPYDEDREEPWNAAAEEAEYYERMIRDYPTSIYARYACWSLGSIRGLAGSHYLRGTPEASGLIEDSVDLFLSVARDTGQEPFGLRATEAAAKALAAIGCNTEAQALLGDAFVWPTTTDSDRTRLLASMDHIETGYFRRSWGTASGSAGTQPLLPLRAFATALGYSVDWAATSNTATVSSRRVKAGIRPGRNDMTVNGVRLVGIRASLQDGRILVSPSVIATLMAAHYGKGMESAFPPQMIARAENGEQSRALP
jgi:hypothetical protein